MTAKTIAVLTTVLELIGLVLIVTGIWLAFGAAVAIIAAGVMLIGVSFLLASRGGRK
ncbi:hypothetical protein JNB62_13125 [Microbacterium jejuense]|uniref:Uncharacterized protein n=1 Tax=Microbacterium jejuense TaxID=1263637 RepID=A0ABS7HQY5_9MICO|nr:hypothetical protein [Microbacterium jejuense]MBW9094632.1 hypothetical protein [Microbacterium jejuense]